MLFSVTNDACSSDDDDMVAKVEHEQDHVCAADKMFNKVELDQDQTCGTDETVNKVEPLKSQGYGINQDRGDESEPEKDTKSASDIEIIDKVEPHPDQGSGRDEMADKFNPLESQGHGINQEMVDETGPQKDTKSANYVEMVAEVKSDPDQDGGTDEMDDKLKPLQSQGGVINQEIVDETGPGKDTKSASDIEMVDKVEPYLDRGSGRDEMFDKFHPHESQGHGINQEMVDETGPEKDTKSANYVEMVAEVKSDPDQDGGTDEMDDKLEPLQSQGGVINQEIVDETEPRKDTKSASDIEMVEKVEPYLDRGSGRDEIVDKFDPLKSQGHGINQVTVDETGPEKDTKSANYVEMVAEVKADRDQGCRTDGMVEKVEPLQSQGHAIKQEIVDEMEPEKETKCVTDDQMFVKVEPDPNQGCEISMEMDTKVEAEEDQCHGTVTVDKFETEIDQGHVINKEMPNQVDTEKDRGCGSVVEMLEQFGPRKDQAFGDAEEVVGTTNNQNYHKHPSVIAVDEEIGNLFVQTDDKNIWKCSLCDQKRDVKTMQKARHSTMHKKYISSTVFKIFLCKMECRDKCHYHCPYCGITILRRIDAVNHYKKCAPKKGTSTESSDGTPIKPITNETPKMKPKKVKETKNMSMADHYFTSAVKPECNRKKQHSLLVQETDQSNENATSEFSKATFLSNKNDENAHSSEESDKSVADERKLPKCWAHQSIIEKTADINAIWTKTGDKFHCNLCTKNVLIPEAEIRRHSSLHLKHCITFGTKQILLCKQGCRYKSHYHCPFCVKTFFRKTDAEKHIKTCEAKSARKRNVRNEEKGPKKQNRFSGLYSSRKSKMERKRVNCPECNKHMFSWNLMQHIRVVHTDKPELVNDKTYLDSVCVDRARGIYLVQSGGAGANIPIHVQKKVMYGRKTDINCEHVECRQLNDTSQLTNNPSFECRHVQSIAYNKKYAVSVHLEEKPLLKKMFRKKTINEIKERKNKAKASRSGLVSIVEFPADARRIHFSVQDEDDTHCYSKMQRVRVTYDKSCNVWYCVCCPRRSCIHKHISKWACLIKYPEMFSGDDNQNGFSPPDFQNEAPQQEDDFFTWQENMDTKLKQMVAYTKEYKRIPTNIPEAIIERSRCYDFPTELHPIEITCYLCNTQLVEELVTSKGNIITKRGPLNNVKVFQKKCTSCEMVYNYQEYEDGVHNFNNVLILSLELCLHLRAMMSTSTAVNRVVESIEREFDCIVPRRQEILSAYLHFESLTDHQYKFACITCGQYPVKLCGDGNKKTLYSVCGKLIPFLSRY